MMGKTSKNWKKVYTNIETIEPLQPTDDQTTVPKNISSKVLASSKRLMCGNIRNGITSKTSPKCNQNVDGKESNVVKPKKTVKSLSNISKQFSITPLRCERCGEVQKVTDNEAQLKCNPKQGRSNVSAKKSLLHYYKNDNFNFASDSMQKVNGSFKKDKKFERDPRADSIKFKVNLDTIYSDLSEVQSTSSEDIYKEESLRKLKEFREKNYFECHSVSRTKHKETCSARDHKCSYRFYLNDRLFPVPICTDYNNTIRCTDCYLPMKFDKKNGRINLEDGETLNGTIQAKIALSDGKTQDLTIILPVKETLIIPERRKTNKCRMDDEKFYFGIIQLNNRENYFLNKNCPTDSLALRYQKGYKESSKYESYRYKKNDEFEFINI